MNISEVSQIYHITPDTIRYYEKIGLIPPIPRKQNKRDFDEESLKYLEMVVCLRGSGVSIHDLKVYSNLLQEEGETGEEQIQWLHQQIKELKARKWNIEQSINRLNNKINRLTKGENQ